jgi:hypothetical protein
VFINSYLETAHSVCRRFRPIAAFHSLFKLLQCGTSLRPFVHRAAFLLAETSVSGQNRPCLPNHQWPLSIGCKRSEKLSAQRADLRIIASVGSKLPNR